MALVLADRVRETTTTTGTGTVTLSGTAPTGYQTFSTAIGNANTTYYTINAGFQWEVGIGTYTTAGLTLSRDTVLSSSSGGALVDFAVGTKDVFVTYPAEKSVNYNASNNVGIGTTAPTRLLSVYDGDAAITKDTASAASSIIYMNKGRGSAGAPANISSGDNLGAVWFNGYSGSGNNNGYGYGAYVGGAADGAVSAGTVPGRLVFATTTSGDSSPTERMRINSSGNVGIGVTPIANTRLYVRTAAVTDTAYYADNGANSGFKVLFGSNITSILNDFAQPLAFGTNNTENMRIMPTGNVGIGTTAPTNTLTVQGTVAFNVNSTTDVFKYFTGGAGLVYAGTTTATAIGFITNGGEKMRITSAGDVGIGTTAPTTLLDVRGAAVGGNFSAISVDNTSAGSGSPANTVSVNFSNAGSVKASITSAVYGDGYMAFATNANTEKMRLDASGYLLVGATSSLGAGAVRTQIGSAASVASGFLLKSTTASISLYASSGTGSYQSWPTGGFMAFGAGPTDGSTFAEAMRIASTGNLGLGTTAPNKVLSVYSAPDTSGFSNGANIATNSPGLTTAQINSTSIGMGASGLLENFDGDSHIRGFWGVAIDKGAGGIASGASNSVNADSRTFSIRQFVSGTTWNTQFCVNANGDVGIGTTAPATGSMSNTKIVSAGLFVTTCGSVSAASGVATTIVTASNAGSNITYIVNCALSAGDPTNYSAVALVSVDSNVLRITQLQTATLMAISVSGTNIRATQSSGAGQTIYYSLTRVS